MIEVLTTDGKRWWFPGTSYEVEDAVRYASTGHATVTFIKVGTNDEKPKDTPWRINPLHIVAYIDWVAVYGLDNTLT